ncbi:ecto-ADP-ribosyltransferase 5-like [Aulostomus maculatus]
MRDIRKTLLAAVVFTALYCKVTAVKQLDLAPEAVDDIYDGCHEDAMKKFVHSDVLKQELTLNEGFKKSWSTACPVLIPGGKKEHTSAIKAYANGDSKFIQSFNDAVEKMGVNVTTYEENFHFKALHFLLMDSIRLLKPKECKNMYRMSNIKYNVKKGSQVRFGRFTSAKSDLSMIEDMDGEAYFNITSCFFIKLDGLCDQIGDEVLLSPAEEFTVEDVKQIIDDGSTYTEITLKHSKYHSFHNCLSFPRSSSPADVARQWLVLVLMAASLYAFNC